MTTLAQLADRAQAALSDTAEATWSQALIEAFCNDALRDYSRRFGRTVRKLIAATTDDQDYDLPLDATGVISVEYPQGNDPPLYLMRRSHKSPGFWNASGYYDIIKRDDLEDPSELLLSENPTTGENIRVEYTTTHDLDLASAGVLTIPAHHEDVVIAYVVWAAWRELTSTEMQSPTSASSLLMGQLQQNEASAWNRYTQLIESVQAEGRGQAEINPWSPEGQARIY